MTGLTVSMHNYRCFDAHGATFRISPGFTAFVGPNNSGTTAALKMFHELRNIFQHGATNILQFAQHGAGMAIMGVFDQFEFFKDRKLDKPVIRLAFDSYAAPTGAASLSTAVLTATRGPQPHPVWRLELGWNRAPHPPTPNHWQMSNGMVRDSHGQLFDVAPATEWFARLSETIYIGAFRNAMHESSAAYYDLTVGSQFISAWHDWKLGNDPARAQRILDVTQDLRHIFGLSSLEINANKESSTLQVITDGRSYKLQELGSGLAQFIVTLGWTAMKSPRMVLIDEPELNLHPQLQPDFLSTLASYTRDGCVAFSTHSIGLARTMADELFAFRKEGTKATVRPFAGMRNFAEFAGEMSFSAFNELGFDQILLVEGATDVRTFQQWLRTYGKDHKIVILQLGGDGMATGGRGQEVAELLRITNKVIAIVDSERTSHGGPASARRLAFEADCKAQGITVHLTERRATENYFTSAAVQAVHGPSVGAFGPYDPAPTGWSKKRNWQVAAQMTEQDLDATDLGPVLRSL